MCKSINILIQARNKSKCKLVIKHSFRHSEIYQTGLDISLMILVLSFIA